MAQARKLQSATKWVETLSPWTGIFYLKMASKGKLTFLPPSPPCNVLPMFELPTEKKKKKHPTLHGGDRGGVRIPLFCEVTLFECSISTILSPIVGAWCINFGTIMFPGYYRITIFFFLELCWKMFPKQRVCAVFGFQERHINRWSVQFSLCGLQNQSSRRTHSG